jgi:hypothetical protein
MNVLQANEARTTRGAQDFLGELSRRSVWATWLQLVPAIALVVIGYLRLRVLGPYAAPRLFGITATGDVAWSDILSIFGRDTMAGHPFPYTTGHSFEYPVV